MTPKTNRKRTVFYCFGGIVGVCFLFIAGSAYVRADRNGSLIRTIKNREFERAIELLDQGADPNAGDQSDRSTFGRVAEVVLRLFPSRKHVDSGPTALMLIFSLDQAESNLQSEPVEVVRALLAKGADFNSVSNADFWHRQPILTHAASGGNAECVRLMLDHGANPNVRNEAGGTPVMLAGNLKTLRLLISGGAEVNAHMNDGYSVLQLAAAHPDAAQRVPLLKAAGARK